MKMTSYYLASKLMTLKLDSKALTDLCDEKKRLEKEKKKVVNSLYEILEVQSLLKSCRLCLRPGDKSIFDDDNEDLANDICLTLQIVIVKDDGLPQYICNECIEKLSAMMKFKQQAETTQWRLTQESEILNENADVSKKKESYPKPYSKKRHNAGYFTKQGSEIVRQWTCKKCNLHFPTLDEYAAHRKLSNCQSDKNYICEMCGRKCATQSSLNVHRLTHEKGPGQFKCSFCDYRSKEKHRVILHERCHTGYKPCLCPQCGKAYPSPSQLYMHKRTHLPDQKKFCCQLCNKGFRHKKTLTDHIDAVHHRYNRHVCKECGKDFSTRKILLRHERKTHKRPKLKLGIVDLMTERPG